NLLGGFVAPSWKAVAFATGLGLGMLSCSVQAASASAGDTVRGLYDALLNTMKNGRTLGQSGRFATGAGHSGDLRHCLDDAVVGRLVLAFADRGAAPAGDREPRAVYLGDLR